MLSDVANLIDVVNVAAPICYVVVVFITGVVTVVIVAPLSILT